MKTLAIVAALVASGGAAFAQQPKAEPIRDNSFLIEEAYNQDAGVVQHINTFTRAINGSGWAYTFTQEWPVRGMRHQVSYTVPVFDAGVGDFAVHYRYQLVGVNGGRLAVSPRVSFIAVTGDVYKGTSAGGASLQTMLPVSVELSHVTLHANAGSTITPRAKNSFGDAASTTSYTLGGSVIWLAARNFNALVETSWNRVASVIAPNLTWSHDQLVIAPGIRWAYNLSGGMQVVPGLAYVIGAGPSRGERSLFVYLSIEHPFAHQSRSE